MIAELTLGEKIALGIALWMAVSLIPIMRLPEDVNQVKFRRPIYILFLPWLLLVAIVFPISWLIVELEMLWDKGWRRKSEKVMNKTLDRVLFREFPTYEEKTSFEWRFDE